MRISKSKQELARIISENGGWRDGAEWAIQHGTGRIAFTKSTKKPLWEKGNAGWGGSIFFGGFTFKTLQHHHQNALSMAEYFHLYPAPGADGWIEWLRDEIPVANGVIIDVKYSDGDELHAAPCGVFTTNMTSIRGECASAESFGRGDGSFTHIIAYRLHNSEQAKPEFCESVTLSIPEPESKPTIEQLMQRYSDKCRSLKIANEHLEACSKRASEAMGALSVACKAAGFDISPITAKQEPALVITDWRDLRRGDQIQCIGDNWDPSCEGAIKAVLDIENPEYEGSMNIEVDSCWGSGFKFIRRP